MFRTLTKQFRAIRMLSGTPHSIALGTAIGLFVAWTPTVGIHMILVIALAVLFRANKAASLIAVYVSNPLTIVPMYWVEYKLGAIVMDQHLSYEELKEIVHSHWTEALWKLCVDLAVPMWLGGTVLALVCAVPGYYLTRWGVVRFRSRIPGASPVTPQMQAAGESASSSPPGPHSVPSKVEPASPLPLGEG